MSIASKIVSLLTPAERRRAMLLLGLMLVGMVLETLGIGLVIPAVTLLVQSDTRSVPPALQRVLAVFGDRPQWQFVVGGMLALVAMYLVKTAFLAFLAWTQTKFAYGVQAHVSQRLFDVYLRQPYVFHLERNSAQLIRNVTTEVTLFTGVLIDAMNLTTEAFVLLGIGTLLIVVEPLGALLVVLLLGLATLAFHRLTRRHITSWGLARQRHEGFRIQHLQQGLGGAKEVKVFGREDAFLAEYWRHNAECARVGRMQQTVLQLPRLWMELLAVAGLAILVITMLAQGRGLSSIVPTLGLFGAAAFRLMPSANRALNGVQSLRYGLPAVTILHDELGLGVPPPPAPHAAMPFDHAIEMRGVTYTYPGGAAPALQHVTLSIRKNESVGFVGPSGSGKSTLVDVLLGLLTPDSGQVVVDGRDIQPDVRAWQRQIGYVSQTIYLTDDTLRRNVAFGVADAEIDDAAVTRAIHAAQLEEFVATLPSGVRTVVGERGVRLSGGQRQRIGIARALYHDPAVLVLDEATSALDQETERDVMESVTALQGSRTIVIVAHRPSTVAHCDRLSRLDAGHVAAEGDPAQMLSRQTSW